MTILDFQYPFLAKLSRSHVYSCITRITTAVASILNFSTVYLTEVENKSEHLKQIPAIRFSI
jgi:hypothetical protein